MVDYDDGHKEEGKVHNTAFGKPEDLDSKYDDLRTAMGDNMRSWMEAPTYLPGGAFEEFVGIPITHLTNSEIEQYISLIEAPLATLNMKQSWGQALIDAHPEAELKFKNAILVIPSSDRPILGWLDEFVGARRLEKRGPQHKRWYAPKRPNVSSGNS